MKRGDRVRIKGHAEDYAARCIGLTGRIAGISEGGVIRVVMDEPFPVGWNYEQALYLTETELAPADEQLELPA